MADFVSYVTTARRKSGNIATDPFVGEPALALVAYTNDNGSLDLYVFPSEEHQTWVNDYTGDTQIKPLFVPQVKESDFNGGKHQPGTFVR